MASCPFDEDIPFGEEDKEKVRRPLGRLFEGRPPETTEKLAKHIMEIGPRMLIVVGDFSAKELRSAGIRADVYVVDGMVERHASGNFVEADALRIATENPAGTVSRKAVVALKQAISSGKRAVVYVKGEEDLLTLPAILLAPLNSIVVYGQPGVGVVSVEVTEEKKREVCGILVSVRAKRKGRTE